MTVFKEQDCRSFYGDVKEAILLINQRHVEKELTYDSMLTMTTLVTHECDSQGLISLST